MDKKLFFRLSALIKCLCLGPESPMRLFLFDSWYDRYHGTINLVQVNSNIT